MTARSQTGLYALPQLLIALGNLDAAQGRNRADGLFS